MTGESGRSSCRLWGTCQISRGLLMWMRGFRCMRINCTRNRFARMSWPKRRRGLRGRLGRRASRDMCSCWDCDCKIGLLVSYSDSRAWTTGFLLLLLRYYRLNAVSPSSPSLNHHKSNQDKKNVLGETNCRAQWLYRAHIRGPWYHNY